MEMCFPCPPEHTEGEEQRERKGASERGKAGWGFTNSYKTKDRLGQKWRKQL